MLRGIWKIVAWRAETRNVRMASDSQPMVGSSSVEPAEVAGARVSKNQPRIRFLHPWLAKGQIRLAA